jgi:hypothetical protein
MIIRIVLVIVLLLNSITVLAGEYIVARAKIIEIMNTASNQAQFGVVIEGGTGSCAGNNNTILFPRYAAGNNEIYKRAYATAIAAYSMNSYVTIYTYDDSDLSMLCKRAAYIRLEK